MSINYGRTAISKIRQPVFLDTSIFIYLFEDYPKYAGLVQPIFDQESVIKITSVITIAEVLTKPIEAKNENLVNKYEEIFHHLPGLSVVYPDYNTAVAAAQIRAQYQFRLIDAFQLAMATQYKCSSFLTNDRKLAKYKNLSVICLDKLANS